MRIHRRINLAEKVSVGDQIEIIKRLPHADHNTPKLGEIGVVTAIDFRKGSHYPIHVQSTNNPGHEDWFSYREIVRIFIDKSALR